MKTSLLFLCLAASPALTGCGQLGPLYLPGTPPPIHVEPEPETQPVLESKPEPKSEPEKNK